MFIYVFSTIFESFIDLGKSRCDIPNGTTQGCACVTFHINLYEIMNIGKIILQKNKLYVKI